LIQTDFPYGQRPIPPLPGSCPQVVPNVQGRTAWEAGAFLMQAGYGFAWDTVDLTGTVLRQDPPAGACLPPGRDVIRLVLIP
jgi:hypothetical protein